MRIGPAAGSSRILLATACAVLLVSAGCESSNLGAEYVEISEEESGIVFYGPGMRKGYRQFLSGTTADYTQQTFAVFGPPSGRYPHATIVFMETPPAYHFTAVGPPAETIRTWGEFEDKQVTVGPRGSTVNKIGRIDYALFTADNLACVNWRQDFGTPIEQGYGTQLLIGYYCRLGDAMMSLGEAESILKMLGHRKFGAPDPPPGWADGARLEDPYVRLLVSWENGISESGDTYRGVLRLGDGEQYLHVVSANGQSCSGTLDPNPATGGARPWALACSNGRTAQGTFTFTAGKAADDTRAKLKLAGSGTDRSGASVVLAGEALSAE